MKLMYWKNYVIRNYVIFHDVTRCSMATIFLWGFNGLILIFIIVLLLIQMNPFYFCECKRGLYRISCITFYLKIAIHSWLVQNRGFISLFCYTDSHYVQKANEPIEQGERCTYKDIPVPLRQYSYHTTRHMKLSSHREMRRGAAKWCTFFWAKKSKTLVYGRQKVIILTSYTIEEISQSPYSHYMDPVSYDFTNNLGKCLISGAFNPFTCSGWRWPDMLYMVSLVA